MIYPNEDNPSKAKEKRRDDNHPIISSKDVKNQKMKTKQTYFSTKYTSEGG